VSEPESVPPESVGAEARAGDDARAGGVARTGGGTRPSTATGPGRLLVAVYAIFALAAGARAAVQIATRYSEAPLAYVLSAVAAAVYVLATVALARGGRTSFRVAVAACSIELVGVLVVGTLSVADSAAFPDETVWSMYGRGYGFIPLVLPVVGLLWLRRTARAAGGTLAGGGRPVSGGE
jgi:cytochrome bd-type quinol oxidase subunit 2